MKRKISVLSDCFKVLLAYEKFYQQIFGLRTDFSEITVPEAGEKFSWFVCVPEGFPTEQAFSGGRKQFDFFKYTENPLDEVLDLSFGRDAWKNPYIVRCLPNYEAEDDLENLSAIMIAEQKINTLTLKERLLLGRFIYWSERKFLDVKTLTLCSGSRFSDGGVPLVRCVLGGYRLDVLWSASGRSNPSLRSRRAVSV